jgi:hypothetical protein
MGVTSSERARALGDYIAPPPTTMGKETALTRVLTKTTRAGTTSKKSRTREVRATKPGTTPWNVCP